VKNIRRTHRFTRKNAVRSKFSISIQVGWCLEKLSKKSLEAFLRLIMRLNKPQRGKRKPQRRNNIVFIYLQMPEFFNEMPEDLTGLGRCAAVVLPKDFGAVVA